MVDFPGHLAGVFFVSGCNFRCGFCHNAALMHRRAGLEWNRLETACARLRSNWVSAAVITGGEPTVSPDLPKLIEFFRAQGWALKLDTNGSRPAALESCLEKIDAVAIDIKAGPSGYKELTGFGDIEALRHSLELVRGHGVECEFRTTVIESFHTDEQMHEIGELIRGARRYVMQPFVPKDHLPDPRYQKRARTSPQRLIELHKVMEPYVQEVLIRGEH